MSKFLIYTSDCLEVIKTIPDASVDAVVTDPPYGLAFMGKRWDYDVPSVEVWAECLRVLKPGGHLLAFAGTRTQHRMAVRIEDAGFEIRDMIAWVYGSGFPKSLDVSKAIDKAAGAEREVVGSKLGQPGYSLTDGKGGLYGGGFGANGTGEGECRITAPATDAARQWSGWGTALKPAMEPITVARKPLIGTVAENVLTHGTGAINVDACKVGTEIRYNPPAGNTGGGNSLNLSAVGMPQGVAGRNTTGRWPANLIHDGSDEVVNSFPEPQWIPSDDTDPGHWHAPAARFFYCAKASKADRDEGCEGMEARNNMRVNGPRESEEAKHATKRSNNHPTVKPTDLMRYLCRLVTPPNGIVLDPFMGSGSTGKAAILEGFNFIGIEREAEYVKIAQARISAVQSKK